MHRHWKRRELLLAVGAAVGTACVGQENRSSLQRGPSRGDVDPLAKIEASVGGRVGLYAFDTGSGGEIAHRADERFAMCSTFKWTLAAAVLARVDRGDIALGERVSYDQADLLDYAPTTREHVSDGGMTVEALARAAITNSDNTAANLLLAKIGGPVGLTRFCRGLGDSVTRVDRDEPTLNTNVRGDVRDTTSPRAMVRSMRSVLCGDVLSRANRDRLIGWLTACETGLRRLRAGLPADWTVGDKTGTGLEGAVNDVAFVIPPRRAPIVIASYLSDSTASVPILEAVQARLGRIVATHFA